MEHMSFFVDKLFIAQALQLVFQNQNCSLLFLKAGTFFERWNSHEKLCPEICSRVPDPKSQIQERNKTSPSNCQEGFHKRLSPT